MGIEGLRAPALVPESRWAVPARMAAFVALLLSLAATGGIAAVSALHWREQSEQARRVLHGVNTSHPQRVDAVVILQRDVRASIAVLREIADGDSDEAVHAQNALRAIREALR